MASSQPARFRRSHDLSLLVTKSCPSAGATVYDLEPMGLFNPDRLTPDRPDLGWSWCTVAFTSIFVSIFLLHISLLRLPYFWDEAGYYVPAARDLLQSGSLIPLSSPSNAHPPLVMAFLAAAWKVLGYKVVVTRGAMLAVSAFTLLGLFRLAHRVANVEVAVGATMCTALYPVFFAQSSLAHVDLAAAGLTLWGLGFYLAGRIHKPRMRVSRDDIE